MKSTAFTILCVTLVVFAAANLPPFTGPLEALGSRPAAALALLADAGVALLAGLLVYFWMIRPHVAARRRAETTLHDTVETISEGFLMFDPDDRLALCNTKFRELYAVASDAFVVGRTFEDIVRAGVTRGQYPEAFGRVEEWIAERVAQHRNPGEAIERQLPNGRWVKITEARTGNGSTVGVRTDITALKLREQQLRKSEERLRHVVEALQEGFVLYDADDRLAMWNDKWLKIHKDTEDIIRVGLSFEQLLRESVARKLYPEAFGREEEFIAERISQHRIPGRQLIRQHRDGSWFVIREVPTAEGGIFAISIDITDLKNAENMAQEARLQAERADKSKSEFLANMSHELRTPLNAIIGFSEIIETETFGPVGNAQYRNYAKDINRSGQHLLALISDILDLTKVESGRDELREGSVDVAAVAQSALKLVRQGARVKGIALELEVKEGAPRLRADERKLTQILINLLDNAIKFTDPSGRVTLKSYSDPNYGYVFQVADTGIGIAPENIPQAMSQFGRVDGALDRQVDGTGLGLPLTKALVELHGGSLAMQSRVGEGTTVTVRFPAKRILKPRRVTATPPAA